MVDIFHVSSTFFGSQLDDLADMLFVSYDHTSLVALLFEQIHFGTRQFTDLDTKLSDQIAFHTISTILIHENPPC